jgi:hypothetical protein
MNTTTPASAATAVTDKRSRNKLILGIGAFLCGLLFSQMGYFLADYHGPWGIRLVLVLVPWAVLGVGALLSRRFYRGDELENLINRQALVFAFYAALVGLMVLQQLQTAGFVQEFVWSTRRLIFGLVLLMVTGILWSKRRYV